MVSPVFVSSFVKDGTWSLVTAIAVFLISASLAMTLFQKMQNYRTTGEYAHRFQGFRGARFPIFQALRFEGPAGTTEFSEPDLIYSFGEANDSLFLLKNGRETPFSGLPLGKLIFQNGVPLALKLEDIIDVTVIERSDEEIAGSAVDRRDFAERFGSELAQRITGTKIKTKIIPYAAYVVIISRAAKGDQTLLAAIPTDVSAEDLTAMGERVADHDFETPWLISAAVAKARSAIEDEIKDNIENVAGDSAADALQMADDLGEGIDEVKGWLDPDAASIATTVGTRGRRMAHLIAIRILQRTGRIKATLPLRMITEGGDRNA